MMPLRILTVVFAVAVLVACSHTEGFSRISPSDLAREMGAPKQNLVLVDVREPKLYRAGHIPGAINVPYPDSKTNFAARLEPGQNIVFVCHGGPMGDEMAKILASRGYPRVRNLEGGMKAWSGPLEREP